MLDSRKVSALKRRLREARDELSGRQGSRGMSRRAAEDAVDRINGLLDDLERLSKTSKLYHGQPDEPYMSSYDEGLYRREPDEPYMDNFRGDEDASEMMSEFGEPRHQSRFSATDEERYDRTEPHEHRGPADDYHIDDDTGVNQDMRGRFADRELCADCRHSDRRAADEVMVECPNGHRWYVEDDKGRDSAVFQEECPECGLNAQYVV